MNQAINFILESGVSLSLLSLIYILFLRKETFLRLNRIFLLISAVFSVLLPFLKFRVYAPQSTMLAEVTVTPYRNVLESVTIYGQDLSGAVVQSISSSKLIIIAYFIGLLIFLTRLIVRLVQIMMIIYGNSVHKNGAIKFVSVSRTSSPFSFLSYIFINPELKNQPGYEKMVAHEMEHIKQGHSFDVLILEIMTVFQWFNPFMWILKRVIRENHEFLADRAVLETGTNAAHYKKLLLEQAVGYQLEIANNFNSSLIKKRIKMLSKIQSSKKANLKYLFGILPLIGLMVVFACEQKDVISGEQIKTVENNERTIKLSLLDEKLKIEGEKEDLEYLYDLINKRSKYEFETDSLGDMYLVKSKEPVLKKLEEDEQVFFIVEKMPEFPGGDLALRKYIANSIRYPGLAQENEIQGKVYVTFVVDKNGDVANVTIARGVDPVLDKEAMRVVNTLPKWKPGYQKGKPVNVAYTVPINFVLQ